MKIDEALKLSKIAVLMSDIRVNGCVWPENVAFQFTPFWYFTNGKTYSLHEITKASGGSNWQPAYIRPQFQIGEQVSFLQACLSGQCFNVSGTQNVRRCINIISGEFQFYDIGVERWQLSVGEFCPSDICTIVADPSQEQSEPERPAPRNVEAELEQLQNSVTDLDYRICLIGDTLRELVEKLGATKNND